MSESQNVHWFIIISCDALTLNWFWCTFQIITSLYSFAKENIDFYWKATSKENALLFHTPYTQHLITQTEAASYHTSSSKRKKSNFIEGSKSEVGVWKTKKLNVSLKNSFMSLSCLHDDNDESDEMSTNTKNHNSMNFSSLFAVILVFSLSLFLLLPLVFAPPPRGWWWWWRIKEVHWVTFFVCFRTFPTTTRTTVCAWRYRHVSLALDSK